MEKNVKLSILCQLYGGMLTEKQHMFIEDYYNNDLSLSEIAENNNITRQAVRDVIKQAENKLFEFEEKLKFMQKTAKQEKQIADILNIIENFETEEPKTKRLCKKIKEKLEKII